jgi:hypothetical protein
MTHKTEEFERVKGYVVELLLEIEEDAKNPRMARASREFLELLDPVATGKVVKFESEEEVSSASREEL